MKALSLWQPWASAIAVGAKRIETRPWATKYRGLLAIHAAKTTTGDVLALEPTPDQNAQQRLETWISVFGLKPRYGLSGLFQGLPRGAVVAICRLIDVSPVASLAEHPMAPQAAPHGVVRERDLGDFREGRYAWILDSVMPLSEPFPCRGGQGLFDVDLPRAVQSAIGSKYMNRVGENQQETR